MLFRKKGSSDEDQPKVMTAAPMSELDPTEESTGAVSESDTVETNEASVEAVSGEMSPEENTVDDGLSNAPLFVPMDVAPKKKRHKKGKHAAEEQDAVSDPTFDTGGSEETASVGLDGTAAEAGTGGTEPNAFVSEGAVGGSENAAEFVPKKTKKSRRRKRDKGNPIEEDSSAKVEQLTKAAAKSKKKHFGVDTVLPESVVETMWLAFTQNPAFMTERDGEQVGVGLLLYAEDVGGLSRKFKSDEAKGSIIEQFRSGSMKYLGTPALFARDAFVIIPDSATLAAMEEYSLLTKAPYELALVKQTGDVSPTGVQFTFQQAKDIIMSDGSVEPYLPIAGSEENDQGLDTAPIDDTLLLGDDEALAQVLDGQNGEAPVEADDDEFRPVGEVPGDGDDGAFYEAPLEPGGILPFDDDVETAPIDGEPAEPAVPEESELITTDVPLEPENNVTPFTETEEVPEDIVEGTIVRKFYSDDLGLTASTEAFDAEFLHTNPVVLFDTDRNDTFLQQSVSELAKDINQELLELHNANLVKMRSLYFTLISDYCEEIEKALSVKDPTSPYYDILQSVEQSHQDALAEAEDVAARRKDELNKEWDERLHSFGQAAFDRAVQEYKDKYGVEHAEMLRRVVPEVQEEIESKYQNDLRTLHDTRRDEARQKFDMGVSAILEEVRAEYTKCLEEERARCAEWRQTLMSFVDDNRKSEFARSQALKEELDQKTIADKVREEDAAVLQKLTDEFDAKDAAYQAEINRLKEIHAADMSAQTLRSESEREGLLEIQEGLKTKIADLEHQLDTVNEQKDREYSGRINELEQTAKSWEEKADAEIKQHKKGTKIAALIAILAVIAALSIGFIGGMWLNLKSDREAQRDAIMAELEEMPSSSIIEE